MIDEDHDYMRRGLKVVAVLRRISRCRKDQTLVIIPVVPKVKHDSHVG